jgi:acetolactate synthase-1/2/3 large subunit
VQLAERLAAPVATTISGKGVFPESHPLWLWNGFGRMAPQFVQRVMEDCDCLLAVGCRFSEVATGSYGLETPDSLIHIDADPEVFNRNRPAAVALAGDARVVLAALLERLEAHRPRGPLEAVIARGHAEVHAAWRRTSSEDRVTPWRMFEALQRHARPDAVYATDSGNGTFLAMEHLRLEAPGRFIGPVDFSCMGYATPGAIGAAFAHPGRDVVALAGDGALLMTGLELLTAATYGAAPVVIVLRDGKLGQIAQFQKLPLNRETCSVLPDYDCSALAAAVGSRYFRVVVDHELDGVLEAAFDSARHEVPAVVEVAIDYSRKTYFTKGVVMTNFWRLPWGDRLRMLGRALGRRVVG